MFFIYFPCALIASIIVYFDSVKQQMPLWWGPLVFFAPAAIPFYFIKTRRKKSILPLTIFLVICILAGTGEALLYSRMKEKVEFANRSPAAKEIIRLTHNLRYTIKQLNYFTTQLEESGGVGASTKNINKTLTFIGAMKSLMKEYTTVVKRFSLMVNDYRNLLIDEKLHWLLNVEEYYSETVITKYTTSLDHYLNTFEALLKYTGKHFEKIQMKSAKYLKNYDGYYMNYARALDRHRRMDVSRMKYQHNFLRYHPALEPYLPKMLDSRFFKIWMKK